MYCKFCGKQISDNSVFCSFCGKRLDDATPAVSTGAADVDLSALEGFFTGAVEKKRAADAEAERLAKMFEMKDGILVKYHSPENPESTVTVPASVTSIGQSAFEHTWGIKRLILPEGLLTIGESAFAWTRIGEINIPSTVSYIGKCAFQGTDITEVVLPRGIASVEESAFSYCDNLESVAIPSGVTRIDKAAFSHAKMLSSITLPDSVTEIGDFAFSECKALTSIALPKGLKKLGNGAFSESALISIDLPDGVEELCGTFARCEQLETVTVGKWTKNLGYAVFSCCNSLKHVNLGQSVTEIQGDAFEANSNRSCEHLTVEIPASVKVIADDAFFWRAGNNITVIYGGTYGEWKALDEEAKIYAGEVICTGALKVGDSTLFGRYPTYYDGKELRQIEWRVLATGADRVLLISKDIIDCQPFYHEQSKTTWERSSLRRWLNDTFLPMAFNSEDQARIIPTTVMTEDHPKFGTKGGGITTDRIFCLSLAEYQQYVSGHPDVRAVEMTNYAEHHYNQRGFMNTLSSQDAWWLRTPGREPFDNSCRGNESACFLWARDGELYENGSWVHTAGGVRPALWIKK